MTIHGSYILNRVLQFVPTLLVILLMQFLLLHLAPGDPAEVLAAEGGVVSAEVIENMRRDLGLDQPLYVQFLTYAKNLFLLDFGFSYRNGIPVRDLVFKYLWPTLLLVGVTMAVSVVLSIVLAVISARRPGGVIDTAISFATLVGYAAPAFWVGLLLIILFSIKLDWLPTSGMYDVVAFNTGWIHVLDIVRHLVLPVATLSLFYTSLFTRLLRASFLEQQAMDYVTTARAKGVSEARIRALHVLRNAVMPMVTMVGVKLSSLLGGAVVIESVFGWPGLGTLILDALQARNYGVLLAVFWTSACVVLTINLIVDLAYAWIDPRIRLK